MILAARKRRELIAKLDSLTVEFKHWRDASELKPLEKHNSQVKRILGQLDPCEQALRTDLSNMSDDDVLLKYRDFEQQILEVHRIWEFFRSKLVLRSDALFSGYLVAADELAWACYKPMRDAAEALLQPGELKEPPLSFLNGGSIPFATPRNRMFRPENVPDQKLTTPAFISVLRALPVPVLGLPWFSICHLPDILVIGHETGHIVAEDLNLVRTFHTRLVNTAIPDDRLPAWSAWCSEVFADLYGTLATGPEFVSTLMDFLAASPEALAAEHLPAYPEGLLGDYPTAELRIRLCLHLLEKVESKLGRFVRSHGDKPEDNEYILDTLKAAWNPTGIAHSMPLYEQDFDPLIETLLGSFKELNGKMIWDVICFTPAHYLAADKDARNALKNIDPVSRSPLILLSAARIAYDRAPDNYKALFVQARVLARIADREPGTRVSESIKQNVNEYDRQSGIALLKLLRKPEQDMPNL